MRKRNKGFTITEIIIVTGLFSILLAVTIGLYVQGNRRSTRLEARLEALQAAQLLRSHLADDFNALIPLAEKRSEIKGASILALSRVKSNKDCGICGTSLDENFVPISERVVYRFDKKSGRVFRNDEQVGEAVFEEVVFDYCPFEEGFGGETIETTMTVCLPDREDETETVSCTFHNPQSVMNRLHPEALADR